MFFILGLLWLVRGYYWLRIARQLEVLSTLDTLHSSLRSTLYTSYSTLYYTLHSIFYQLHSTLLILRTILYTLHFILDTLHLNTRTLSKVYGGHVVADPSLYPLQSTPNSTLSKVYGGGVVADPEAQYQGGPGPGGYPVDQSGFPGGVPSPVSCLLSAGCWLPSPVSCLPSVVCCVVSAAFCLLSAVCCLLSAVVPFTTLPLSQI
jgi:hypothetical protein